MIKVHSSAVAFAEFPDEIALCLNISNCPNRCPRCSEPWLRDDIGEELTETSLRDMIAKHPGVTLVGFMGGDCDHAAIARFAEFVHFLGLKVGMYSGRDVCDPALSDVLDYYKIGRWIAPEGDPSTWPDQECGPLSFPKSNQRMFRKSDGLWEDITYRFREKPMNDLENAIM